MSINQLEELIIQFAQKGYITKDEWEVALERARALSISKEIIESFIKLRLEVSKTR